MEHQSPKPKPLIAQLRTRSHLLLIASLLPFHLFALFIALQTTHWIWVLIGLLTVDMGLFFLYRETQRRAGRVTNLRSIQRRTEYRFAGILVWRRSTVTLMGTDMATGRDIVIEPLIPPLIAMIVVGFLTLIALAFDWFTVDAFLSRGAGAIFRLVMTVIAVGLTGAAAHFIGCIIRDRRQSLQ